MLSNLRFILLTTALLTGAHAEIRLPKVFTDGEVLQRDRPVPVWGWAAPGKEVTVKFAGKQKTATAAADGRWRVDLEAMPANAQGQNLEVSEAGAAPVTIKDVLIGEVWLASGQSNMEFAVAQTRTVDQEIAKSGPVPLLRLFQVQRNTSAYRQDDLRGAWEAATPETCQRFSAVGYFFGRRLTEELKVPVGIIHASWGGSRIEPWFADEGFEGVPELEDMKNNRAAHTPGTPAFTDALKKHVIATRDWTNLADAALKDGKQVPEQPPIPQILPVGTGAGNIGLYQAMIHPLVPYGLRGFLWYQGESNVGEGMLYTQEMQVLINGWRRQFGVPAGPFLYVQIAPYNYGQNKGDQVPELWVAQQEALKIPHTGMAVTNDIGNVANIHPDDKSDVGYRLARWALAETYGKTGVVASGPLYNGYEISGDSVKIKFKYSEPGLSTRDDKAPDSFEIAGADGVFKPALAGISGGDVILKNPGIPQPKSARFAWSQVAEPNLRNNQGLPAGAFNTHWPEDPDLGKNVALKRPFTSSNRNTHDWDSGLTDGSWAGGNGTCYATGEDPRFPKNVTVDLGGSHPLQTVRFGVPGFGSTKTIAISVSEDGKSFKDVGSHEFAANTEAKADVSFAKTPARYVRATFVDHYPQQYGYAETFGFMTDLQAFEGAK
ncbi:MAG: type domain protein [Akkermansiaceae bacterium]|nr:type domain protein [Akkermansiaceae bacterium]